MENIISEYQRWKQQGTTIRTQARQAMETKFRELLTEAAEIAQEYHSDFGVALKPPASITSFKFKTGVKAKNTKGRNKEPKSTVTKHAPDAAAPAKATPAATNPVTNSVTNSKLAPLQKKLALARKKLDTAKSAGSPTRNLEDRIYEIEDEIRLASQ